MKILIATTSSGTIHAFLEPHINMLLDQGHTVDLACNMVTPIDKKLLERGCKVFILEFNRTPTKKDNIIAYKKLKIIIEEEAYDLVHTHTPVASACVRLACRKMSNVRVFYSAHGFHFYKGASLKNWLIFFPLEWWLAKYTDLLITINKEDFARAKKFFKTEVVHIHGAGVNKNKYYPYESKVVDKLKDELGYLNEPFTLLCTGEFNNNKNQSTIIKATARAVKVAPNIKLLLAGCGPNEENLRNLVKELSLEEYVEFLGFRADLEKFVNICDIVLSASYREGLGLTIVEGMFCGKPVIASINRGHKELVEEGVTGYLVEAEDVEGFKNNILKLYGDKEKRKNFGVAAINNVKLFTTENVLDELNKSYGIILDGQQK